MYTLLWRARMTGFFRGEDIKGGFEQMYKIKIGYQKIKKKQYENVNDLKVNNNNNL